MDSNDTSLLVIASYPPIDATHHPTIVGGASYTKNTLLAIEKIAQENGEKVNITVLAEKLGETEKEYKENSVTVKRIWQRNSISSFFTIAKEIHKNSDTKKILFSFELAMFGGKLSLIGLIIFLFWLKLNGKKTFIILHQVIENFQNMEGHLGTNSNSFVTMLNNYLLQNLYRLIISSSEQIIVFEEVFKEYLDGISRQRAQSEIFRRTTSELRVQEKFYSARENKSAREKIIVIPHGVETFSNALNKKDAKEKLNISEKSHVILLFGFLAWYKGTDWIVDVANAEQLKDSNTHIIIAGGPNPNRLELPFYRKYLKKLEATAKEKHITITGFVPEDKISMYFQAADVVIFPYRTLMSSSGPLSIALSFHTPILLADPLQDLIKTYDFAQTLSKHSLSSADLFFKLDKEGFTTILQKTTDVQLLKKLTSFTESLAQARSWQKIGKEYYEIIQKD